jgi:MFS family permease
VQNENINQMNSETTPAGSRFQNFLYKFAVMRHTPRELWVVYGAYILENLAYKLGAAGVLTLWLSHDLGFGDKSAGATIALWSAIMTLITVMIGSLTDALGIRRTFLIGFILCLISRTVMTFSVERWLVLPAGLYLQAAGIALMIPVMTAACKKYSNAAQRSVAFALYYALMNLGYAIGDLIFDHLRGPNGLGEHGHWIMPWLGTDLSTYRVLIFLSLLFTVPGLLLVWFFLREGVEMTEAGIKIAPRKTERVSFWISLEQTVAKTWSVFASLWQQPTFYRFLAFMTLAAGAKMIFFHLSFTFPKYGIRELGDGAPFAHLSGFMNSIMIVFLVPICAALTQKISAYWMVVAGSFVSALSVFIIALPPAWFQSIADGWLGHIIVHQWLGVAGPVNPLYISIFFFIFMLSIGEAFWSPRLYEYAGAIAPKGQEASYMALSLLPFFLAKLFVGVSSGWLLENYCPPVGARHSEMIWVTVGALAMITPVGIFLFRKQLQLQESGREPVVGK